MHRLGEVFPKQGIGSLKLGESKDCLLQLLGEPIRESINRRDGIVYNYEGFRLTFNQDEKLESIEVYPGTQITYKGLDIFNGVSAWEQLIHEEPSPLHLVGTIVLLSSGVSMWEDPNEEEQNKSFVISADGVWDDLKSKLKPYEKKPYNN